MNKSAAEDFLDHFDDSRYPADFLLDYEILECLRYNELCETLLVRDIRTDAYYIAKCCGKNAALGHIRESDILKELKHKGLPGYIGTYENDKMQCVVREFIKGNTLDMLSQNMSFTREQAVSVGIQLCEILSYLHGHTPPIIHRDIKPQNIVMDNEGSIGLIDFGISHYFNEENRKDTVCFGTMEFAPPEQYGFSQTDSRADIYSLGILLCWLITGDTDIKKGIPRIKDRQVRHIIKKCTAFAPEKRYSSAKKARRALLRAKRKTYRAVFRAIILIMACGAFFFAGFSAGRYTDLILPIFRESGVKFEEPLIEQAVRLVLNKQEGESITEEELINVTELYICGDKAAESREEFDSLCRHMALNDGSIHSGKIRSLKDIAKLEDICRLNIVLEDITDLSPLSGLNRLEQIELKHNPIEDLSPLKALPSLRELYLYDTLVSDLSVLSDCPRLDNLVVGDTNITSLKAFAGLGKIVYLHAEQLSLDTLSGIEEYACLQEIGLTGVADGDLTPLLKLPQLKRVYLSEALSGAAEQIAGTAKFDIIYQE